MVIKYYQRDIESGPPPMDESWWEAVMAEDEQQENFTYTRKDHAGPVDRLGGSAFFQDVDQNSWNKVNETYDQDQVVCLNVTGYNRGGLLVCGDGMQGFVPISHLVDVPEDPVEIERWLETYLDQSIHLKVIECDSEHGRIVFSERAALARPGSRNELLRSLTPGEHASGTVTNITDFGVFVDLGGVEGLVHVSEISWGRVHHPADVVTLGQQVEVYVIQVDPNRARVALSLKRLRPNPWETAERRYKPGQVTEAIVTSVVPFGVFARVEEGLDGLIHVSEMTAMSRSGPLRPKYNLRVGQRILVRVLQVDGARQRLGLSLRLEGDL